MKATEDKHKNKLLQPTHPLRDAINRRTSNCSVNASIHAPRRDAITAIFFVSKVLVTSTHASFAGCDQNPNGFIFPGNLLQLMHPSRDAICRPRVFPDCNSPSIHASLSGCDPWDMERRSANIASTHAPLTGCDISCVPFRVTMPLQPSHS